MSALAHQAPEGNASLAALVSKAAQKLAAASSSAEILEARDAATLVYDLSKREARFRMAKNAHDDLIAAAHRAQADALLIESEAKRRLADEYDAAQERGEVAKAGNPSHANFSRPEKLASVVDLGLTPRQVHEARQIRDAEEASPGVVKQTLDRALVDRREPTRAELQRSVVAAAMQGLRNKGRSKKPRNPNYKPDPYFSQVAQFSSLCEHIAENDGDVAKLVAYDDIPSTAKRLRVNAAKALQTLLKFQEISNA